MHNAEIVLASGAKLHITLSPFKDAKALYQALLEEARTLKLDAEAEADFNFFKDVFCTAFSSKRVETALEKCFERCTYNDKRITADTFEPAEAREDYMQVCLEVAQHNVHPFTKSLSAQFSHILALLSSGRE